jgi:hypothetical protein
MNDTVTIRRGHDYLYWVRKFSEECDITKAQRVAAGFLAEAVHPDNDGTWVEQESHGEQVDLREWAWRERGSTEDSAWLHLWCTLDGHCECTYDCPQSRTTVRILDGRREPMEISGNMDKFVVRAIARALGE